MRMNTMTKETKHLFDAPAVSVARYVLFSSLVLIVVFAWMEPAGAAGIGFWKGLIFWTIQISILIPLLIATQRFASLYIKPRTPRSTWIQTALSGIVGALLFVPIGYLLDLLFAIPDDASSAGIFFGLLDEAAGVVVPVVITWLGLNAPWVLQLDFSRRESQLAPEQEGDQQGLSLSEPKELSGFFQELRSRASGSLISLSSELHYLRVTTTDAEVMFLYNLRDAIEELPSNFGIQVHRSHWVAREHIKKLVKRNGNAVCILSNGKSLPVSRRKYSEVRDLLASEI
jgi:hypothetical protein